jgi:hypothetical protein
MAATAVMRLHGTGFKEKTMAPKHIAISSVESDPLYSVNDSAQFLGGISPWTIRAWITRGLIMRTKVGGRTFIRESELRGMIRDEAKPPILRKRVW